VKEGVRTFYESPAIIGCPLAVQRDEVTEEWVRRSTA
jgi:hypothetical protein